jgi:two-component system cell cycle sensor histidine kinase/response regulator CckA
MNVMTQFPAVRDYERDLGSREVFEGPGAEVGIGICRLDGRILSANPVLSQMLGYSQQELAATHAGELYPELGRELFPEANGDVGRKKALREPINRDPTNDDCPNDDSPNERLLGELMRGERASFDLEKHYRRKDESEFWGHLTVSLGCDAEGAPAFLITMLVDATERRREEEHLRTAEKMEVIGRLAGGIAHDFNNLLTGILLYCDLLSAGLESAGLIGGGLQSSGLQNDALRIGLSQHVQEVRMASEQGAALTHQLLAIARKQAADPRPIAIDEIVASTKNLLRRLIGEQIELVISLDSASLDSATLNTGSLDGVGGGMVLADPAQLRQILLNLVLNARDALPQGGEIQISTRSAEFPSNGEPGKVRRAVVLAVKDNGCGMDAETCARLFEPFFTTKNPGEGTGLGLATVQRIVNAAGGRITVVSELGSGTLIEVFLPTIQTSMIEAPNMEASSKVCSIETPANENLGKTILLVDDHAPECKSMHEKAR